MSRGIALAGAGFLLGVLWMDLLFDVQALGAPAGDLPEAVLSSIAGYYRRVTSDAAPLGSLVGFVMAATFLATGMRALRAPLPRWRRWLPALLVGAAATLAMARVFPNAVILGARTGTLAEQSGLARSILHEHLACLAAMLATVALLLPRDPVESPPAGARPRSEP